MQSLAHDHARVIVAMKASCYENFVNSQVISGTPYFGELGDLEGEKNDEADDTVNTRFYKMYKFSSHFRISLVHPLLFWLKSLKDHYILVQNPPCFNESTTKDLKKMSKATPEELLGIIQGLTDAMKLTHEQQQATNTQVQQLSNTIKDMSTHSKTFSIPSGLRLPAISLPKYSGLPQDNLERFLEHFDSILTTSSIPARDYVPYLKQQVQEDIRAFDVVTNAEKEHFTKLIKTPDKATDEEYLTYYNRIKEVLILKRGKPKEQQIRELLSEYYSMQQGKTEKVSDFAHRFQDNQNELEKHITNIHSDLELQYAFAIKLRKSKRNHQSRIQIHELPRSCSYGWTLWNTTLSPINKSDWQPSAMSTHSADTTLKKKLACRFCHKTNHLEEDCFQRNKQAKILRPWKPNK